MRRWGGGLLPRKVSKVLTPLLRVMFGGVVKSLGLLVSKKKSYRVMQS